MKSIKELQAEIHKINRDKGWWDTRVLFDKDGKPLPDSFLSLLMLVTTEVAEAAEEVRDGKIKTYFSEDEYGNLKPEGFADELADVVIRIMDICEASGIDLQEEIELKLEFNKKRKHRHGGRLA